MTGIMQMLLSSVAAADVYELYAWGKAQFGTLGLNDTIRRSSPVQVGSDGDWFQVSSTGYQSLAVKTDGTLWSWGAGYQGRTAQNDTIGRSSPTQVGALTNWKQVSCCSAENFAIKTNGTLWAWGLNNFGQLGINISAYAASSPVQVGYLTTWDNVLANNYGGFAVKTDGTMWSWGFNSGTYNNLAQGPIGTVSRSSPAQVGSDTDWALG